MKLKLKLHFLLLAGLLLWISSCDKNDHNLETTTIERTVLVYIMGHNTLSGLVDSDISEILEGAASVDLTRNNLLVYMDDGSTVKLFRLTKNGSGTIVEDLVKSYGADRNSVGLNEMKEVFSLVYMEYPAESYGLVLWSHGDGWKPGRLASRWIGQDWDGNALLSISTLSEVLNVIPYYEYILFDACFMQSIEVAYELRHHTGYFIGSPAEIPGPGAPYQKIVPAMFAKNDAAISIARSYYDYYHKKYNGGVDNSNVNWTAGVAISVIATDKLESLAEATRNILPTLIANSEEANVMDILNYDRRNISSADYVGYYDFDMFMKKQTNGDASYTTWSAAFDAVVPYAESTAKIYSGYTYNMFSIDGFSGVSTYVPQSNKTSLNTSYQSFEWYTAAGW